MRIALIVALLVFVTAGCSTEEAAVESRPKPSEVEVDLAERIALAQEELRRVEAAVEATRQEAMFFACQAEVEDLNAEVNLQRAECMLELAAQAECKAGVERGKGDASLLGCALGLAAAAFSGGSAAPWALGGCAAGRLTGEAVAKECPVPVCVSQSEVPMALGLEKRGWSQLPQCGGRLGVEVETPLIGLLGVLKVTEPGRLTKAGLQKNDMIAYVGEERVKTPESLKLLFELNFGKEVEVSFVRDELLWKGHMTVPRNVSSLRYHVENEYRVTHRWGARVKSIDQSGAISDQDAIGRDITHVDDVEVANAEHLRDLLRYRKPGTKLELQFRTPRSLEKDSARVTLVNREDKWAL